MEKSVNIEFQKISLQNSAPKIFNSLKMTFGWFVSALPHEESTNNANRQSKSAHNIDQSALIQWRPMKTVPRRNEQTFLQLFPCHVNLKTPNIYGSWLVTLAPFPCVMAKQFSSRNNEKNKCLEMKQVKRISSKITGKRRT